MKLNLTADGSDTMQWWVDASYAAHWDCKGHTGMMMSLGKGAAMSFSRKQKLNARSSTVAELFGIDDALPSIIWGLYFMMAQGYEIKHNILYQDNKSTILLAKNGRMSASSRLKHIHTRFYLVKDHQERGEIEVKYEPTGKMWSDILTKPKQGKVFREFRGHLMNIPEDYDDEVERKNTHPDLLPKQDDENPHGSQHRDTLRKAVGTDVPMTRRTIKASGHRRSVLSDRDSSERDSSEMRTPRSLATKYDTELARLSTKYDTELARKVSRMRALRYLRERKSSRIRNGTRTADVPRGLLLQ